jgi:hypothetical protein
VILFTFVNGIFIKVFTVGVMPSFAGIRENHLVAAVAAISDYGIVRIIEQPPLVGLFLHCSALLYLGGPFCPPFMNSGLTDSLPAYQSLLSIPLLYSVQAAGKPIRVGSDSTDSILPKHEKAAMKSNSLSLQPDGSDGTGTPWGYPGLCPEHNKEAVSRIRQTFSNHRNAARKKYR